jgi:hypothetical protein
LEYLDKCLMYSDRRNLVNNMCMEVGGGAKFDCVY